MTLPPDLITRVRPLVVPFAEEKSDRKALLTEAFYFRDPRVRGRIELDGNPDTFTVNCIAELMEFGCLAVKDEHLHALAALLLTIRSRCGVDKHPEIDRLIPMLNSLCDSPVEDTPPVSAPPAPTVSVDTPFADRQPTVFISYSHTDEAFAKRLIGDLKAHGHACWIDTVELKGGDEWTRSITEGINNSYAFVTILSVDANESTWVKREYLWADAKKKLIIPLWARKCAIPIYMIERQVLSLHRDYVGEFQKLLAKLPTSRTVTPEAETVRGAVELPTISHRELELAYLDRLRFEDFKLELFELAEYAPLTGEAHQRMRVTPDEWQALAMRQEFALIKGQNRAEEEADAPPEKFTDAVSKITELRRVVVLGEPGAGKTHTLRAIAKPLYTAALSDPAAPIPLMIKLGNWDKPDQPFEAFVRGALGELGTHLDDMFAAKRAILLLDGLNEFPADQRTEKYPQVETFIKAHPDVMAVVTCREADYPISLHLSRVMIRPLDPLRIRDFARRALREIEQDDAFFWKLVGADAHRFQARFKMLFAAKLPDWETVFWVADALPAGAEWEQEFINGWYTGWDLWRALRDTSSGILTLARNPYMLRMLLDVYIQSKGEMPPNRGQLFYQFVIMLLKRERLVNKETGELTEEGKVLLTGLQRIAYEMQMRRARKQKDSDSSAGTSLDMTTARRHLNERLLYLAVSTSILTSGDEVRFSHQLLQEYFAARYMDTEIKTGRLNASDIWDPANWWERTNWEEAAILLAGLYSDNCTPILNWVAEANPEVSALCIARSGATTPDETKRRLRDKWLPRLSDIKRDPSPLARAAVGRALGLFTIDDLPADNRKGVSVIVRDGGKLPDIDWVRISGGEFVYADDNKKDYPNYAKPADRQILTLPAFQISRYLITYAQFQTFIDAADGWNNPKWWEGLSADDDHKAQPGDQAFKFGNHPRERVSWYDAVAFCRWVSAKLGYTVTLPTEQQYERASRWTDGRLYPYQGEYDPAKANTDKTGIRQTSAVGIFPNGASVEGIHDLSGNVWEWCLNAYSKPENKQDSSDNRRVLRGCSWDYNQDFARTASRYFNLPHRRSNNYGFRVVVSSSS